MDLGPEGWLALEDPFPAWRIATEGDDDTLVENDAAEDNAAT
jgi:hypothetical protein